MSVEYFRWLSRKAAGQAVANYYFLYTVLILNSIRRPLCGCLPFGRRQHHCRTPRFGLEHLKSLYNVSAATLVPGPRFPQSHVKTPSQSKC